MQAVAQMWRTGDNRVVSSLPAPLCGFWGSNSGHQASRDLPLMAYIFQLPCVQRIPGTGPPAGKYVFKHIGLWETFKIQTVTIHTE